MRGKWAKGGLIKRPDPTENTEFTVVGVSESSTLYDYGRFTNLEEAKQQADKNASKDLTCYVYSEDNRVIYSTEK